VPSLDQPEAEISQSGVGKLPAIGVSTGMHIESEFQDSEDCDGLLMAATVKGSLTASSGLHFSVHVVLAAAPGPLP